MTNTTTQIHGRPTPTVADATQLLKGRRFNFTPPPIVTFSAPEGGFVYGQNMTFGNYAIAMSVKPFFISVADGLKPALNKDENNVTNDKLITMVSYYTNHWGPFGNNRTAYAAELPSGPINLPALEMVSLDGGSSWYCKSTGSMSYGGDLSQQLTVYLKIKLASTPEASIAFGLGESMALTIGTEKSWFVCPE